MRRLTPFLLALSACSPSAPSTHSYEPGEELSGGATTVFDTSRMAFTISARNLGFDERGDFAVGNNFFGDPWVTAPASTEGRDGLGPMFNALACASCHVFDGRGQPPEPGEEMSSSLIRLSVPGADAHGGPLPEPSYGGQLNPRSILGVPAEARTEVAWDENEGAYADGETYSLRAPRVTLADLAYGPMADDAMTSLRVAPAVFGLGLLEAVPEATIRGLADPDDADEDGISGRASEVWDVTRGAMVLGRFGWKAGQPTVRQQTAGALLGDIGITSSLFPAQDCTSVELDCQAAPVGGDPECSDVTLGFLEFYGRTIAVPARRDFDDPTVVRGKGLFHDAGCASCHVPTMQTGDDPIPALVDQTIRPYTDLLLHDMGEELADGRPDGTATGTEWRTPPLWGIGLVQNVNRHSFFLHDGRARGFAEAILWHGGEAEAAREAFRSMTSDERDALVRFLESL